VKHADHEVHNPDELTEADIEEINHNDSIKETEPDTRRKTNEEITKDWEENMKGFVPEDFLTIEIEEGSSVMLHERINHSTPTKVRGAYYVVGGNSEQMVSAAVLDDDMSVIFKHHKDIQGIMHFDSFPLYDEAHEYSFLFTNESPGTRVITFGLHTDEPQKSYNLPEWDLDASQNLIDRPKAQEEKDAEEDEKASFEDMMFPDSPNAGRKDTHAANEDDIGDLRRTMRQLNGKMKVL